MSVNEFDIFSPFGNRSFKIITKGVRSIGDLLKHPAEDGLLPILAKDVLVEFNEARLPAIIDDDYALDHYYGRWGVDTVGETIGLRR